VRRERILYAQLSRKLQDEYAKWFSWGDHERCHGILDRVDPGLVNRAAVEVTP